jgi:hypothetical protein
MHQFITGHWAASNYSAAGGRADHNLFISPDGSFTWSTRSVDGLEHRSAGSWTHGPDEDVLRLRSTDGDGDKVVSWSIHYISDLENANTNLVLRWLALASRNLPIVFYRVHPPGDPVRQGHPVPSPE